MWPGQRKGRRECFETLNQGFAPKCNGVASVLEDGDRQQRGPSNTDAYATKRELLHTWKAEAEVGEGTTYPRTQARVGGSSRPGNRAAREGGSRPVLPDSQSILSTDRPAHLCSDLSPCFQPRLSGFSEPFLPPVPHHPPLSNPLIIFTTTAPTPHCATAALWVSHPQGCAAHLPACVL